jgi:hypothetical protein
MDWNLLTEIESNFTFPSDSGTLVNPSFDGAESLTGNLSQWDGATSTCYGFTSYNCASTKLEDPGYDDWKLMDISYNLQPTSSEEPTYDVSKLDTLEKGPSQVVNGGCLEGMQDCKMLGLDQVDDNFMLVHELVFLEFTSGC